MKSGQVVLSDRLQMLANMVTRGNSVADVGCDHGFLSVYLVQNGISPHVLAMDVRKGPLAAAQEHIEDSGLNTYIETRLSDGLEKLEIGEADSLVCAGMGGRLMKRILLAHMEKARSMGELILQPQSELKEFRIFLRQAGFRILTEDAVYEEGKYYFAMKAVYAGKGADCRMDDPAAGPADKPWQNVYDEYGELLLEGRHPVLRQYLRYRREGLERILERLEAGHTERTAGRLVEVRQELTEIEKASGWFEEQDAGPMQERKGAVCQWLRLL